jgi:hypothetical protein
MADPLVLVPHGIWAIFVEHRNNLFARPVALALMERPVLPESTEDLPARGGMELRFPLNAEFSPEGHLLFAHRESSTGEGAGSLHGNIRVLEYQCIRSYPDLRSLTPDPQYSQYTSFK